MGLLGAFLLAGCGGKAEKSGAPAAAAQKQPVEVAAVTRRDLAETLNLVGTIAANESATIRPEINGLVRGIYFEEGQRVSQGHLLMRIDDSELQAQLAQSEARYHLAELNFQRAEKLRETRSNTEADVDRARSEFASARSDRELIKVRLDRSVIKAPFDGIVGARTLSPGDYVNPQAAVTTLDDLSRLKIEFQVPERFLAKVKPGTTFTVNLRAEDAVKKGAPAKVSGSVYFVSSVIDRSTRASQVKGFLADAPPQLKPGMFANVELVLSVIQGALTVPEGAVLTTPGGARLVVVRDRKGEKVADFVPVRLGLRSKGVVEVQADAGRLADRDEVVASGVGALILFPGSLLDPRPARGQFKTD